MSDPFASVRAMLEWQCLELQKIIKQDLDRLDALPDSFRLPKQTHGLPEGWPWGSRPHHEVLRTGIRAALSTAQQYLNKAIEATQVDDYPTAIYALLNSHQSQRGAWAGWVSGNATRLWRYVDHRRMKLAAHAAKGNRQRGYTEEQKRLWRAEFFKHVAKGHSKLRAAQLVARIFKLPKAAVRTIRAL